jgi:hypothetical protein
MTQEPVYGAIWPNAAEWPSDATLSYQYMTEARAAASATGPIKFYGTKAQADADIGTLANGDIIEISQDETRAAARTRYKVQAGALVFVVNLDQVRVDLAAPSGASLVGFGSGTVADQLVKVQEGKYATNGGRIGVTSDSVPLASPGALVHIVNKSVTAGFRVSSYWEGSTAAPYQNNDCSLLEVFNKVNSSSLNLSWGGSFANAYNNIPAGVTDSGERVGVLGWATSVKTADYTHSGTLEYQFGVRGRAGFQGPGTPATAVVNNAIGVRGEIHNDSVGATITNARAGEFISSGGAGTVVNNIAVYAGATGGTAANYSFYGESGKLFNTNQILAGSTATQSNSKVGARGAANSFEFGNPDPTGYGSNIGSTTSSGYPFIAFCAEADASGNTFSTRGKLGTVIHGGLDGSLLFGRLTNANAGGQSITYSAIINPSGQLSLSETVVLKSKTPASATAPGVAGEVCWDAGYVYVCVATNAWRRAALAAW